MNILFLIFIFLMPFSPLLFMSVDMWHGAGQYFQVGLLVLFSWSFFERRKEVLVKNVPLGLLTAWLGLATSFWWFLGLKQKVMNFAAFAPFFNFLCFLLFYQLAFQLKRIDIERIIRFFGYSICVYLIYCSIQYAGLDPFFKLFAYTDQPLHRVVGFVGNETQNAAYLAMCLPVFYLDKRRLSILLASLIWAIIAITGSGVGIITALAVTVFFSFFYRLPIWYYTYLVSGAVGFIFIKNGDLLGYFNLHGRTELWINIFNFIKESRTFIWGSGLGAMNMLSEQSEFYRWRHAHNEYLQTLLTAGIVGFLAVIYCIWEYFRNMLKDRLAVVAASLFLGFCVTAILYFNCHIWIQALIGMMGYSFLFVLKNEEKKYAFHT